MPNCCPSREAIGSFCQPKFWGTEQPTAKICKSRVCAHGMESWKDMGLSDGAINKRLNYGQCYHIASCRWMVENVRVIKERECQAAKINLTSNKLHITYKCVGKINFLIWYIYELIKKGVSFYCSFSLCMLLIACCQCRVAAVLTPTNYEHNKSGKRNKNECDYMSGNNKCSTRHLHKWQALPASRCSISTSTSTSSSSSQLLLGSSSSLCCSNSCS